MTNPLHLLDAVLAEWASPKVRRTVHSILLLATAVLSIWLAVEQDWEAFLPALVATLYVGSNRANTPPADADEYDWSDGDESDEPDSDAEVSGNL